jgi:hypothetical protein
MKLAIVIAAACAMAPGFGYASTSQDYVLTGAQFSVVTSPGAPNIEARLARVVKDDRCPSHETCVWAGPVVVEIEARQSSTLALLTLSSRPGETVAFQGWTLALQNVEPAPAEAEDFQRLKPLGAYRAVIRMTHP